MPGIADLPRPRRAKSTSSVAWMIEDWQQANRAWWDEAAPIHAAGDFYDLKGFLAGRDDIRPFEPAELGSVDGLTLCHLQCHLGTDTLSWARRGARFTGPDLPAPQRSIEPTQGVGERTPRSSSR